MIIVITLIIILLWYNNDNDNDIDNQDYYHYYNQEYSNYQELIATFTKILKFRYFKYLLLYNSR
jgi:hypothetical protein